MNKTIFLVILVFVLGSIIVLADNTSYCGDNICDDNEDCLSCVDDCGECNSDFVAWCNDTDGGLNSVDKGVITFNNIATGEIQTLTDYCSDSVRLSEYYCMEISSGMSSALTTVNCQNYCEDGKCIPLPNVVCGDDTCDLDENYISCPEDCPFVCIDTDGGENYFVKGNTDGYYSNGRHIIEEDYCNNNEVVEYYCLESGYAAGGASTLCENGCIDGACVLNGSSPGQNPAPNLLDSHYYYYTLTDNDCEVNLTLTSKSGSFIMYANRIPNQCTDDFDEEISVNDGETKTLTINNTNLGSYSLKVRGSGRYKLTKSSYCHDDITRPKITLTDLPYAINESISIKANVLDENVGLNTDCKVCISPSEICNNWYSVTNNFAQGDKNGFCQFILNPLNYQDNKYYIQFKVSDLSNNEGTSVKSNIIIDKSKPSIVITDSTESVDAGGQIKISALVTDGSGISKVEANINQQSYDLFEQSQDNYYLSILGPEDIGVYKVNLVAYDMAHYNTSKELYVRVNENLTWSSPIQLNFDSKKSFPISYDEDNNNVSHIVFHDTKDGNYEIYYTKLSSNGNLLVYNKRITTDIHNSKNPSVSVDDNIHIVWEDDRDYNKELYYTKLNPNGDILIDNKRITSNLYTSRNPRVLSGNNEIFIIWIDNRSGYDELYFKKLDSSGNIVTADMKITENSNIVNYDAYVYHNIIHIVWQDTNGYIQYAKVDSDGNVILYNDRLTIGSYPSISVDSVIHLAKTNVEKNIEYQQFNLSGEELLSVNITSTNHASKPYLIIDPENVHIAWQDNENGYNNVYYSKLDKNGFSLVENYKLSNGMNESLKPIVGLGPKVFWHEINQKNEIFYYSTTQELETTPPIITNVRVDEIHNDYVIIKWETDEPSNSQIYYGETYFNMSKNDLRITKNHKIVLTDLKPETSYKFYVGSSDILSNNKIDNNYGSYYQFSTESQQYKPALPTNFYGHVQYQDGEPAEDILVTATWMDTSGKSHSTHVKTLTQEQANQMGNNSIVGYYIFNLGNIKAKIHSNITVSAPNMISQNRFIESNPGGDSIEISDPIIIDTDPPIIDIHTPINTVYQTPYLHLNFTVDEPISWAGFKINNNDNITITNMQNSKINIVGKIGDNTLTVYAKDLLGLLGVEIVHFKVEDSVPPDVVVNPLSVAKGEVTLIADVIDATNPLSKSCEVCITTDGLCNTEWTSSGVVNSFTEGDFSGKCLYNWDTTNLPSATYTFNFRVSDETGNRGTGLSKSISIDRSAPSQVRDLEVSSVNWLNALDLNWQINNENDFYEYHIYRSYTEFNNISAATYITNISNRYTTNYRDTGLVHEQKYYYAVTAVDKSYNENNAVNSVSGTVVDVSIPIVKIVNPIEKVYNSKNLKLTFNVNEPVIWCQYSKNGGQYIDVVSSQNIVADEGYNYLRVKCSDASSNIGNASVVFTVDTVAPDQISGLIITPVSGEPSFNLTWNSNNDQDFSHYNIYRSLTPISSVAELTPLISLTSTNYKDIGLASDTTYYYAVTAVDENGNENPLVSQVSGTTGDFDPPQKVSGLLVQTVPQKTELQLSWHSSTASDFSHYNIYRSTSSFSNVQFMTPVATSTITSYIDAGLESERTYYYAITAVDENGNEETAVLPTNGKVADINPPSIIINNPKNNQTYITNELILDYSVNEVTTWCGYSLNNASFIEINGNINLDVIEGQNSIIMSCTDSSGNIGNSSIVEFNVVIPPAKISGLTVTPISQEERLYLEWNGTNDEDFSEYRIYRSLIPFTNVSVDSDNEKSDDETDYVKGSLALSDKELNIEIIESDQNGMQLKVTDTDFTETEFEINGEAYQVLSVPKYSFTSDVGKPQLPSIRELITIPPTAIASVEIINSSFEIIEGYNIYPVQEATPDLDGASVNSIIELSHGVAPITEDHFVKDNDFYAINNFYPTTIAKITEPGYMRNLKVNQLIINPIQYNPVTHQLKHYTEFTIKINYEEDPNSLLLTQLPVKNQKESDSFNEIFKNSVINYNENVIKSSDYSYREPLSGDGILDGKNKGEYLIISADVFYDDMKVLEDWKTERGLDVMRVNLTQISEIFGPGSEGIHDFIEYAYFNWQVPPTYVLLVGDVEYLPVYHYPCVFCSYQSYTASDHYYACVDGTDYYPDVHVGRLSVKNSDELDIMINKIIDYQSNTGSWKKKISLIAHSEGAPGKYQGCKEEIRTGIISNEFTVDTVYPYFGATKSTLINVINNGRGIINYRGHGSTTAWGDPYFSTYDISGLNNNEKTPIIFSIACWNNRIDYSSNDCFGEEFSKDPEGALTFLSATVPSPTTINHDFDKFLFKAIFNKGLVNVGAIMSQAKIDILNLYGTYSVYSTGETWMYLLLGDPELSIDMGMTDLSVSDLVISPNNPSIGERVNISAVAWNNLDQDVSNILVRAYLGEPTQNNIIGETTIASLNSGSSTPFTISWDTSYEKSGTYDIYIKIDPLNSIAETNENNNQDFSSIAIKSMTLIKTIPNKLTTNYNDVNVTDGNTYYYAITAVDLNGYENSKVTSVGATVDISPPLITMISPISKIYGSKSISVSYYANEEIDRCYYSLNSGDLIELYESSISANEGNNTIKLVCFDNSGNHGETETISFRVDSTAPGKVIGLNVQTVENQASLDLSWNSATDNDFSHYKVYRSLTNFNDVTYMGPITTLTNTNYLDTNLVSEQRYYYAVTAVDNMGNEDKSVITQYANVADINPPAPILGLTVENVSGQHSMDLTWIRSSENDFDKYNIYRSATPFTYAGSEGSNLVTQISGVTTTSYRDTGLIDSKLYYYAITAIDEDGNENKNVVPVSGRVTDLTAPIISIIAPIAKTYNSKTITVSYTANEEIDTCYYSLNSGNQIKLTKNTITASEGSNRIKLFCDDRSENTGESNTVFFDVDTIAPNKVTGLMVNSVPKQTTLKLSWDPSSETDLHHYNIYRSTAPISNVQYMNPIKTTTKTNYDDTNLMSEQTYYYAITAVDEGGNERNNVNSVSGRVSDAVAPKVTIISPTSKAYGTKSINLSYTVDEKVSYCEYSLNGASNITISSNISITAIQNINTLRLTCSDESGNIGFSYVQFEVDLEPPSAVNNLVVATILHENSLQLTWSSGSESDISYYNIYRSLSSFTSVDFMNPIGTTTDNSFKDNDLTSELTYYYAVTAVDNLGNELSDVTSASGIVADTIAPEKINGLMITTNPDQLTLTWNPSNEEDLSYYKIYRAESPYTETTYLSSIGSVTDTNYSDFEVIGGTTYFYAVTAVDVSGNENHNVDTVSKTVTDITPPIVSVSSVGSQVSGKTILSATLSDTGVGLKRSCAICITQDGICDFEWNQDVVNDFNESDATGTCYYEWDTTDIEKTTYMYNFKASDVNDNEREGIEKFTEVVNISNTTYFNIQLKEGWNLISLPLMPYNHSTSSVLQSVDGSYKKIYFYDPETKNWEVFNPRRKIFDQANSLLQLNIGKGYWIDMNEPATLTITGSQVIDYTTDLVPEWNYIGYPYIFEKDINETIESVSDDFYRVYSYDANLEKWNVYKAYESVYDPNTIDIMSPGKGYLINMKSSAVWSP